MRNTLFVLALSIFWVNQAAAQQVPGLEASNYGGLYRATYNPSVIGGPKHDWQINIGSLGGSINYRYFVFLGKNSLLYPILAPHSTDELYGRSRTMGSLIYKNPLLLVSEIRWPSASIALGKYQGLAFQLRTRGFVQGNNIPEPIRHLYFKRLDTGSLSAVEGQPWGNFNLVQQSFSDASLTYGAQILDLKAHKIRIGATVKKVFGARIAYLNGSAGEFSIRPTSPGSDTSQLVISGFGYESGYSEKNERVHLGSLFNSDKYGSGWGYDLGITYELGSYWHKSKEVFDESPEYLIRLGASLTDIGTIHYKTAGSKVTKGYLPEAVIGQAAMERISDRGPEGFMEVFPSQSDSLFSQKIRLPQAVHFEADIQLVKSFFLNLAKTKRYGSGSPGTLDVYQPEFFTITPRFEDEDSDFAFPISFIKGNNRPSIGAVGHFGPIFLGFSNVNGLLKSRGARGSMVYVGFTAWKMKRKKDAG